MDPDPPESVEWGVQAGFHRKKGFQRRVGQLFDTDRQPAPATRLTKPGEVKRGGRLLVEIHHHDTIATRPDQPKAVTPPAFRYRFGNGNFCIKSRYFQGQRLAPGNLESSFYGDNQAFQDGDRIHI